MNFLTSFFSSFVKDIGAKLNPSRNSHFQKHLPMYFFLYEAASDLGRVIVILAPALFQHFEWFAVCELQRSPI